MGKGTIIGLIVGFGAILLGFTLEKGNMSALLLLSPAVIVFGGTIGAVMRGVVVGLKEALLFNSGSADVNSDGWDMLQKLSEILKSVDNYISVEGSADNVPISSSRYESNWELASQRAINVAKLLQSFGVDPTHLSSTSYGEYRPVVPNDSEANKERNRRVDIVIIDKDLNEYQPGYENSVE